MKQLVLPIKGTNILHEAEDTLLHNFREGHRNYTIPQTGKATLFQVNGVLALRRSEIYRTDGDTKKSAYTRDRKTGKPNTLCLKPAEQDLIDYFNWLNKQNIQSEWLFPSSWNHFWHTIEEQFCKATARTSDLLEANHLETHSMRKTGTCRIYTRTYHNTDPIMSPLNHTSEAMALKYLGLDQVSREKILGEVKFD